MNTRNLNPCSGARTPRSTRLAAAAAALALTLTAFAQTERITPAGDGSFSNGTTFGDNGWTVVNASNGPWELGTLYSAATPFSGHSAYISLDGGATSSYNPANPATTFFYRDVTVPAGETVIQLSFNWFQVGESSWDIWQVFYAPTTVTPVASNTHPGSGTSNVPAGIAGATYIGNGSNIACAPTVQTATFNLPPALAGTTFRLIFSWKSDTSVGGTCPAAIDNISLTSALPTTYTAAVPGGLWNSPASWVGGVVPPGGNNVAIPNGSTIVVNQSVFVNDLVVDGKLQWTTSVTPSATVNTLTASNITIGSTGQFLAHGPTGTGVATTGGATINVYGDFINDGFANLAAGGTVLWFLAPSGSQTLGGLGSFMADKSGRGMIPNLLFATQASCTISTAQDIVTNNLGATAGLLTTNNKLHIDNTAISQGALIHRSVYTVTVNAHGAGYTSAPTVTFSAPPAGTTATGTADWDPVTQTVRSITITDPGSGYRSAPTVTIAGGGGAGATAVAHVYSSFMFGTVCQGQKSGQASTAGSINIPSSQGVVAAVTAGGTGYTSAPNVGVSLPTGFLNLVGLGGSGYTSAPTVTITGGGGSGAAATAVVCRGQVVSVNITAGGTNYTSPPTITLTGGGGTGATATFPASALPTFTATVADGMVTSINTVNPGFGYLAAPTITLTGGGGTGATVASRASLYNLIHNFFSPASANVTHTESAFIPTNRRINAHSLTNAAGVGMILTDNLTLYASAPMTTFTGFIDMNGYNLHFDHPTYTGTAGSATAYVQNGTISHRLFGSTANQLRNFPFNAFDGVGFVNYQFNTGTATPSVATDGSTVTFVKATQTGAPSGLNAIGTRALRLEFGTGQLMGTNPTVRLSFNAVDNLGPFADQPNLFIAQSSALSGPWTPRSVASGTGPLPATGFRTTATTAPGPIVNGEEYFAWYSTLAPCSGTPDPGNTVGSTLACPSVDFTLSLQNLISGTGVTYQWERADDAGFTVNLETLGTASTQVTSQTTAKYYRCLVTCTNSAQSAYSNTLFVDMGGPCQCTAYNLTGIAGSTADEEITQVVVGSMTNNSTCATLAPGPGSIQNRYSNYTTSVTGPTVSQLQTVSFSLTQTTCGGVFGNGFKIYIDYNQDGDWLDAGEEVYSQPVAASGNHTKTGTFTVPLTATVGTTRMRVVNVETTFPNTTNYAHTAYTWGETEDYCITIEAATACSAPPAPSTTISTLSSACTGVNFTLSLGTSYAETGITYQWESAEDNAFTVNPTTLGTGITEVTSLSTVSLWYRCAITCTNPGGGTTYSTPIQVTLISDPCICGAYPSIFASSTADEEITNVTVGTLNNNSNCSTLAPGPGSIQNRYSNYTGFLAAPQLSQGTSVSFSLTQTTCGGIFGNGFKIYIDYNQDGDWLDAGEEVYSQPVAASGNHTQTGTFTVPLTALLGSTRMRVVNVETTFPNTINYAHTAYTWGETEDYCVEITPPPVPASATATINDDCPNSEFTIIVNIANFGSGTPGDIIYSVNAGPPVSVPAVLGPNTIPTSGAFSQPGDAVSITVTNNTISDLNMGTFFGNCPITVTCGSTLTLSHCYGNNDPRTFTFVASNPGETVTLTFVSGTMDANDVIRGYSGTDNTGIPIIDLTGSFANLASPTVTGTSTGNELFLEIDSDGSNSCQDAGQSTWVFEVECTPGCVDPDGTATYDLCTQLITVDLNFDGDGATAGIRYIVNGGPNNDITGLNAPHTEVIGPFTPGDVVQVFLLHENDGSCNKNLGSFNIVAPAAQPTVLVSATPSVICAGGSSTLNAVASGGAGPVPTYVFQTATGGTLADMSGATTLLGTNVDDTASPLTNIGFTFQWGTPTYTQFTASSNGQLTLGGSNASLANNLNTGTPRPLITAWWDDLHTGSDGYVITKLFGSPGSYIRVVEWKVRAYPGSGLPTTMLMQAWLYESGIVELRYGPASATSGSASIGVAGATTGAFQSVTSPAHTVSTTIENASNTVWPGEGRIYRWLRPEVPGTVYTWSPATYLSSTTGNTVTASGVAATTTYTVSATVPGGCPETASVTVTVDDPITAGTITPDPASFCTGGSVTLTATPSDGVPPFTYAWTGPGGPAGTAQTQVVTTAGLWSCVITDACSGTVTVSTNVTSTTPPVVSINATSPICAGGSVTLSANIISGTVTSYLWGGAAPVGGQTTPSVTITGLTPANNGNYTLTAFDGGCASTPASYNLSVNPNPSISSVTATPNPVCEGGNSVLNVSASLPTSAYCSGPFYSSGCSFPDIISNVTFAGINRTSACDNISGTGFSVITSPQGNVVAGTAYTLSVTTDGDLEGVTVWIDYNRNGAFEGSEIVLQRTLITSPPQTSTASVTIPLTAFNGATRMRVRCNYNAVVSDPCSQVTWGEIEDYTINITGGAEQLSYLWSGGTFLGGIDNTQSVTATNITTATTYNVLVTAGTGCTSTGSVAVGVNPLPPAPDCGGPYPTLCVADPPYTLTPTPGGGVWSGTGVTPGGVFDPSAGTQTLTYTVTDINGCQNSCTVTVNVNSADTDGDGIPDCADDCPLLFGQIGDPCDPGPGFILGTIDPTCTCVGVPCTEDVRLQVTTDNNGAQTTFEIREDFTNLLVCSGGPFVSNATITQDCCLPAGCYNLLVFDSGGDGIVGGGYVLREANGGQRRIIDNRYDELGQGGFTNGSLSQINDSPGFCVPMSDDRLIYTSCDKRDWKQTPCGGEYVVANENTAVTAQYGINNANSGYQMWWYDPNGNYSFKRFQSHNTTNGLPASPTRACHFRINAWSGNQLVEGTFYNVKVRGRVNGVYNNWGAACRFILNSTEAQCPRAKLMDIPGNSFLSCGQTRAIGTNQLVHARPVKRMLPSCSWQNANRYQFRFMIPAESIDITKTSATGQYWVNTLGLPCGKTFEVYVRASFDGGATWCHTTMPWGDMCLLTTTCSFAMAPETGSGTLAPGAELTMHPNPNRGDQLFLGLSRIEEGVEKVTVEIFDAYGKRAITRTIPVQDGFLNTVMELNEQLADGLYMVNVTAGEAIHTKRLVIQK